MMASHGGVAAAATAEEFDDAALARLQRRTVGVLGAGQVLGGLAFGATISLGAILARELSGQDSLSGLATASITLGTAIFAVPLARTAQRFGRRIALTVGMLLALVGVAVVIGAVGIWNFPLLLAGFILVGTGQSANLQSRFAATDLATDRTRGRDLSIVVWATTVGAVLGPNLVGPGEALGEWIGMPPLTGPYLFTVVAQLLGVALYFFALRPDPLLLAVRVAAAALRAGKNVIAAADRPRAAIYAIIAIAGAHGVMVAVMAMTPVHLMHIMGGTNDAATVTVIGFTISLHIAGMYALSPVFGILADKLGRVPTILLGQAILVAALLTAALGQGSTTAVTVALVLLGLGWSASTVAGSTLLTEASAEQMRTKRQGRSDLIMSLVAAAGAVLAGVVLGWIGFAGLALIALGIVAVVVVFAPMARMPRVPAATEA
ncbi:MAG: MFS transporter [Microthrixaceae bacterium]|nr:MFS transporter [Microthrixaceae bacterium]